MRLVPHGAPLVPPPPPPPPQQSASRRYTRRTYATPTSTACGSSRDRGRRTSLVMAMLLLPCCLARPAAVAVVTNMQTEHLTNPLGLDKPRPRFAWQLGAGSDTSSNGGRGLRQTSYRVLVGKSDPDGSVWDSGRIASSVSFQIQYGGPPLANHSAYRWTVIVSTSTGSDDGAAGIDHANTTAPTALFSMGMLSPAAWSGQFIGFKESDTVTSCPWFRKSFILPADATTGDALLSVASVGFHEPSVNGKPATAAVLLPSASFLPKRVLYRTYNVSSLLRPAGQANVVGIWAAAGWADYRDFRCNNSFDFDPTSGPCRTPGSPYRAIPPPLVLVELHVGQHFSLVSDSR